MTNWKLHPLIYEINTWPWLINLSKVYSKKITLGNLPDQFIIEEFKFYNSIWLMGVWKRSPAGRNIAQTHKGLIDEYSYVKPNYENDDIIGSPYAIKDYVIAPELGGVEGLKKLYKQLKRLKIKLILDFVPNHVAIDHPWLDSHPEFFIRGKIEDLQQNSSTFFQHGNHIFAHGKDPYFDAWTDTVQLNAFSSQLREQVKNLLLEISEYCDGVRCDMAMLMVDKIFNQTWENYTDSYLPNQYWVDIIPTIKSKKSSFLFIAEVYWDMEWDLQQMGFDFCYDKRLYDRFIQKNYGEIKNHLKATWDYQSHLLRFLENHDEPRIMSYFDDSAIKPLIALMYTLPGAHLLHSGQEFGYLKKTPVQLGEFPEEIPNETLHEFYIQLFSFLYPIFGNFGTWQLLNDQYSPDYSFPASCIIHSWIFDYKILLIICNQSDEISLNLNLSPLIGDKIGVNSMISKESEFIYPNDKKEYRLPSKIGITQIFPVIVPRYGVNIVYYRINS